MIGRSIIILQLGNDKNEIYEADTWSMCISKNNKEFEKTVIEDYKKNKWTPAEVVSDSEVEKIVYATSIRPSDTGYHKWASDCVGVINVSDNPSLPNPAEEKLKARKLEIFRINEALDRLKEFIPELVKLRNAIPTGTIKLNISVPLVYEISYEVWGIQKSIVFRPDQAERLTWVSDVLTYDELRALPELQDVINCPYRKIYQQRCKEIGDLLGLGENDVENQTYYAVMNWNQG